jgi:hypothetical protein
VRSPQNDGGTLAASRFFGGASLPQNDKTKGRSALASERHNSALPLIASFDEKEGPLLSCHSEVSAERAAEESRCCEGPRALEATTAMQLSRFFGDAKLASE